MYKVANGIVPEQTCLTNALIFIHIIQDQPALGIMLFQKWKQQKVRQYLYSRELRSGTISRLSQFRHSKID